MPLPTSTSADQGYYPHWWRMLVIACATLVLCSCRSRHAMPPGAIAPGPEPGSPVPMMPHGGMPQGAMMPPGAMGPGGMHPGMMQQGMHPGMMPPGAMPPGAMPPGMMHPAARPQGMMPTAAMQPQPMPPQSAPHQYATLAAYQQGAQPAMPMPGPPTQPGPAAPPQAGMLPPHGPLAGGMPPEGMPPQGLMMPPGHRMPSGHAMPYPEEVTAGPWRPPGIACPWPRDEYLFDGGDDRSPVRVSPDFTVHGLEMEDTIAHYDQLDGRTCVTPSNKVCLYAPRFMAVRSVTGLVQEEQIEQPFNADRPTIIAQSDEVQRAVTRLQNLQPGAEVAVKGPDLFLGRDIPLAVSTRRPTVEFAQGFLPYENFRLLRTGQIDDAERPFLAVNAKNAIAWVHNQGVQVLLKDQKPGNVVGEEHVMGVHTFDPPCPGKIRICKVASSKGALPGEIVDFTLRYDNIGASEVGNVTIIDNLTTRLEYVAETAQSSRKADFFTTENTGGSLILRWEIIDPVPAGQGGIIRFRCRVR